MAPEDWHELLAWVTLGCAAFLAIVDLLSEFAHSRKALHIALLIRWSIGYTAIRYIGIGCAVSLALDVIL